MTPQRWISELAKLRVSILSGVAKRDVDRLVSSEDWLKLPKPTDVAALVAILHRWHTDAAFLGPYGVPLELSLTGHGGRSFGDLVAGSSIQIDSQSAFEQLLSAGVISRSGETHVKVLSRSYVMPEPLSAEMLEHFGISMTNLASTLHFNMTPNSKAKRLERSVFPDEGLPEELFNEFDAYVRERAHAWLSEVDDWIADASRRPIKDPSARVSTGVSVFHYVATPEPRIILNKHVAPSETRP